LSLRALVSGCWFGHADRHRERINGVYALVCSRCSDAIPINASSVIRTGAGERPAEVSGVPKVVVVRERHSRTLPFRQSER
jgi:hypothetical protein